VGSACAVAVWAVYVSDCCASWYIWCYLTPPRTLHSSDPTSCWSYWHCRHLRSSRLHWDSSYNTWWDWNAFNKNQVLRSSVVVHLGPVRCILRWLMSTMTLYISLTLLCTIASPHCLALDLLSSIAPSLIRPGDPPAVSLVIRPGDPPAVSPVIRPGDPPAVSPVIRPGDPPAGDRPRLRQKTRGKQA